LLGRGLVKERVSHHFVFCDSPQSFKMGELDFFPLLFSRSFRLVTRNFHVQASIGILRCGFQMIFCKKKRPGLLVHIFTPRSAVSSLVSEIGRILDQLRSHEWFCMLTHASGLFHDAARTRLFLYSFGLPRSQAKCLSQKS